MGAIIEVTSPEEMDKLEHDTQKLKDEGVYNYKGAQSGLSHLKAALYDWRGEEQWDSDRAFVFTIDMKSFIFFSMTKGGTFAHCTLRHIFVMEGARGEGTASKLYQKMLEVMKEKKVSILRMFINIPALGFYAKKGITEFHGNSKIGLPFYYGDLEGNLKVLPESQRRYVNGKLHEINTGPEFDDDEW